MIEFGNKKFYPVITRIRFDNPQYINGFNGEIDELIRWGNKNLGKPYVDWTSFYSSNGHVAIACRTKELAMMVAVAWA